MAQTAASGSGGKAGSAGGVTPRTPPRTSAPKRAAAKPGSGNADNEKKARALLANYQLAVNVMSRVAVSEAESPDVWAWAQGDCDKFKEVDEGLQANWAQKSMRAFVQDLRAAVFSPAAVKAIKKKHS